MIGIGNTQLREVCAAMLVLIYLKSQHLDMTVQSQFFLLYVPGEGWARIWRIGDC